jgi:hypothetical protein
MKLDGKYPEDQHLNRLLITVTVLRVPCSGLSEFLHNKLSSVWASAVIVFSVVSRFRLSPVTSVSHVDLLT